MDPQFTAINQRAIARAIKSVLVMKAKELLAVAESESFINDFFADPGNPTVDKLIEFKTFYEEVVVKGWTFMKQDADTPDEIEQVFAHLAANGVSFENGAP